MRLSLRLILSLVIGVTFVTFLIARNQVRTEKRGLRADLERRAEILASSLGEIVQPALVRGSERELRRTVERFEDRQQLAGVIIYDPSGEVLAESASLESRYPLPPAPLSEVQQHPGGMGQFMNLGSNAVNVYYLPLYDDSTLLGVLAIFHDANYIEAQSQRIWREALWHSVAQVLLIVAVTLLILRWTIVLPISRTAQWMKDIRGGRIRPRPSLPKEDFLAPFSREVVNLARSLSEARAAAEE